jgi:hypothetical protein
MADAEEYQPVHEELPSEEIRRRLKERAELAETLRATRPREMRIAGEGSALEPEPAQVQVISIRDRIAAQRRERGEDEGLAARESVQSPIPFASREQRRKLNVDPAKLAELVAAAQATADESVLADEIAESAGAAAHTARLALDAYLEESGLAG